jgi:hypothetical protein
MTTATLAPAPRAPGLTLDERLALAGLAMDNRLAQAAVAYEVNTAHVPAEPPVEITVPHLPQPAAPAPYRTPLAALLHRAAARIETSGWARGCLRDDGRLCAIGAIRAEADSRGQADDASALLLEVVRREFGGDTVPVWNDSQAGPRPVILGLQRAADVADSRGL